LDVPLAHPTGQENTTTLSIGEAVGVSPAMLPADFEHTVYECYTDLGSGTANSLVGDLGRLDLDENGKRVGFPLPYQVALDLDSKTILAIRRHWKKGDPLYRARKRFVKYGFIPGFGPYDWGLIHIAGNPTMAATMIQRQVVDAGMWANVPSWAIGQSAASRMETTVFRPAPGEAVRIPVSGGAKISDVLMPWPVKPPSEQSMAMEQKLEGDVRKLAGTVNIPVGEGRVGNTPVGTIMAYIEAVTQVPGAVHKDDHIAQEEEFELLRELIAEEPEVLTRGNRTPARQWQIASELLEPDLLPASDPNTQSHVHRLMKAHQLVELSGQMQFLQPDEQGQIVNRRAIYRKAVEVLTGESAAPYEMPPSPMPQQQGMDPKIMAAQINAQSKQHQAEMQLQGKVVEAQSRAAEAQMEAQQRSADRGSEEWRLGRSTSGSKWIRRTTRGRTRWIARMKRCRGRRIG
jgi:hypothetical protein